MYYYSDTLRAKGAAGNANRGFHDSDSGISSSNNRSGSGGVSELDTPPPLLPLPSARMMQANATPTGRRGQPPRSIDTELVSEHPLQQTGFETNSKSGGKRRGGRGKGASVAV